MPSQFRFFPEQGSTLASRVDLLYIVLLAISAVMTVLIFTLILVFMIRYRRGSRVLRGRQVHSNVRLELIWSVIPLVIMLGIFAWGADIYFERSYPPAAALDVYVVGKQWMWKLQHPQGKREINELHVPRGYPVRLTMISQDVIHSFYVPAFRMKQDVLPGRYTTTWFEASQTGEYHLFCAEYCGTDHSRMKGRVIVMEPADYQAWLQDSTTTFASRGEQVFNDFRCGSCHSPEAGNRAPLLTGAFGRPVALADGQTVTFDANYARESILHPKAKVVAGYEPIMPTFEGQLDEEQLLALLEYLKSLSGQGRSPAEPPLESPTP
ncbi:MAG: cytochrome c oxidase subunit II [Pirellulales bacterium]